jgi:FKBP-type peptidyl-prolyl cis-trans isomerase 2
VTIEPADAYGPKHEQLVQTVSLEDFAAEPYVGGMVTLVSPEGDEMPGRIVAIEGDEVTLDFNHPLAGQTLVFEIELVAVEDPEA